jgi:ketosteroid isomerase-like protein
VDNELAVEQRDVELVRGFFERRERGDYAAELLDPDIEYTQIGSEIPDFAGEWRGVDRVRAAVAEYLREWEDYRYQVQRFIDLGNRVLVLEQHTARGRSSGVEATHESAHLLTLRDRKIVRWEAYWDPAEAMRAAGLAG